VILKNVYDLAIAKRVVDRIPIGKDIRLRIVKVEVAFMKVLCDLLDLCWGKTCSAEVTDNHRLHDFLNWVKEARTPALCTCITHGHYKTDPIPVRDLLARHTRESHQLRGGIEAIGKVVTGRVLGGQHGYEPAGSVCHWTSREQKT
jgi:hypothetical protein